MQLRRFRGRQLAAVMQQVREALGSEALILHTRSRPGRGLGRWLGTREIEIVAAVDEPDPPGLRRLAAPPAASVEARLEELRGLLVRLGGGRLVPTGLRSLFQTLCARGVPEPLALELVDALGPELPPPDAVVRALAARLASSVTAAAPSRLARSGLVSLVGPPGAGKTVTLAKLAARARVAGTPVVLASLDEPRLGAPDPLRAFAGILEVPYVGLATPDDVGRLAAAARGGLTLVDTPGLVPQDRAGLAHLGARLGVLAPAETHLVLSATAKVEDGVAAARAYAGLGPSHLLVTRLDETATPGTVLALVREVGLPLSFFGTGPEVPGDLEPARPGDLVARLVPGEGAP